ncbi:MAG TPA: type III secretion system chaperone [Pyrinomonadaceae bacterium]|nr:type III secretion system chaperone [Pyrinomonadaceae bacterium]
MKGLLNRDEAVRLIRGFFKSHGLDTPGLNESNLGGASLGDYQIYFEYQPANQTLQCSALVYRFRDEPKPGVIEGFEAEADGATADAGGATLEYQRENKGLYLTRSYSHAVSDDEFANDLRRLMKASLVYGDQVLDRVAAKVFTQNN